MKKPKSSELAAAEKDVAFCKEVARLDPESGELGLQLAWAKQRLSDAKKAIKSK